MMSHIEEAKGSGGTSAGCSELVHGREFFRLLATVPPLSKLRATLLGGVQVNSMLCGQLHNERRADSREEEQE